MKIPPTLFRSPAMRLVVIAAADRQPGDEGADDEGQLGGVGEHGEAEDHGEGGHRQRRARPGEAVDGTEDVGYDENAEQPRQDEEAGGEEDGRGDDADRHRVARHDLDDDGEDDQPEHVVGHSGAEHDARLDRRQGMEVAEDAGGQADARRGQGGPEEDCRVGVPAEGDAGPRSGGERRDDADDGDQHRSPTDPAELGEVHLHADLDQQQQDPDLGEDAQADAAVTAELDRGRAPMVR